MKTPDAIESTLARLQGMGISAIELARIKWVPAEINTVERVTKELGMEIGSTQNTFNFLRKKFDWSVKLHRQLNCQYLAVSVLPMRCILGNQQTLCDFAVALEKLGAAYRQQGLRLLFHHHHFEFKKYADALGLDILLSHTTAENLGLVLDTYWLQRGGRTPHDTILELSERVDVVHLRDYRVQWKYLDLLPADAELGGGNLNFGKIIESCKSADVAYMAIEQETRLPFDDIAKSVNHLKALQFQELF